MNILSVVKNSPYPITDGVSLRVFNIFKLLSRRNKVSLFCLDEDSRNNSERPIPDYFSPLDKNFRKEDIARSNFDVICLIGRKAIENIGALNGKPVLVDLIDDPALNMWRGLKLEKSLVKKIRMFKWHRDICREAKKWSERFKNFVVVSSKDSESLSKNCKDSKISVVSNGVDSEYFNYQFSFDKKNTLLFSGAMDYPPNNDAAIYFIRSVYPEIKKSNPKIKLIIAGKNPGREILSLSKNDSSIEVTGFVEDIREYFKRASVYVCPLRWGSGVKNKILEAWAMSVPIVATPISCEGLEVENNYNLLIAKSAREFANQVQRLIDDRHLCKKLALSGRELVVSKYSWQTQAERFENILKEVVKQ